MLDRQTWHFILISLFLYEAKALHCVSLLHIPAPILSVCDSILDFCVLVFLKKENVFVFFPEIYSSYIFVLNNIFLFFPFMRADILGFSNFSWVWFLFPLNDGQFQSLFYLDHLPVSSAHSYTGLHHFLSIITFCYNYQCAYLDSISWGKTKHFRH